MGCWSCVVGCLGVWCGAGAVLVFGGVVLYRLCVVSGTTVDAYASVSYSSVGSGNELCVCCCLTNVFVDVGSGP